MNSGVKIIDMKKRKSCLTSMLERSNAPPFSIASGDGVPVCAEPCSAICARRAVGAREGAGQDQRTHPLGVAQNQVLGDHAAHAHTEHVRTRDSHRVEDGYRVVGEQLDGVRSSRLVAAAGAAVVEDDGAIPLGEGRGLELTEMDVAAQPHDAEERLALAVHFVIQRRVLPLHRRHAGRAYHVTARRLLLTLAGFVVSALGLLVAFGRVRLHPFSLDGAHSLAGAAGGVRLGALAVARGLRRAQLLDDVHPRAPASGAGAAARRPAARFGPAWRAVTLGMLAQTILPARLGEAARAFVIIKDGDVPAPNAVGALALGRVLDLVALLCVSCAPPLLLGLAAATAGPVRTAARVGSLVALLLLAGLGYFYRRRKAAARAADGLRPWLGGFVGGLAEGLSALGSPSRLAEAALTSLAIPATVAASYAAAAHAFGISAPRRRRVDDGGGGLPRHRRAVGAVIARRLSRGGRLGAGRLRRHCGGGGGVRALDARHRRSRVHHPGRSLFHPNGWAYARSERLRFDLQSFGASPRLVTTDARIFHLHRRRPRRRQGEKHRRGAPDSRRRRRKGRGLRNRQRDALVRRTAHPLLARAAGRGGGRRRAAHHAELRPLRPAVPAPRRRCARFRS